MSCFFEVTIPDSVKTLGPGAFFSCNSLSTAIIGTGIATLDDRDTNGALAIPDSLGGYPVTGLARRTFAFRSMTHVFIPASVTDIGREVFRGSERLEAITVSPTNPAYSHDAAGALPNKSQTTLLAYPCGRVGPYSVPPSVTRIEGGRPFGRSPQLTRVSIPDGVTYIVVSSVPSSPHSVTLLGRAEKENHLGDAIPSPLPLRRQFVPHREYSF